MKTLALLLLLCFPAVAATYTEFYCDSAHASRSNLNAGSTSGAPTLTVRDMTWDGTSVFTVSAGTDLSGISAGMWGSVFDSTGADPADAVYIARVTAVDNGAHTVTLSTTDKSGTAPTAGVGDDRGLIIGGVWAGPNGADGFPISFVTNTLYNSAADLGVRINLKSGTAYAITTGISTANAGPIRYQGYTTTVGDGGHAQVTTASAIVALTMTGANVEVADMDFISTVAAGTSNGVSANATMITLLRVRISGFYGSGFYANQTLATCVECELDHNNKSNTAGSGGAKIVATGASFVRCYIHENTGTNNAGIADTGNYPIEIESCVFDGNGAKGGIYTSGASRLRVSRSDFYANVGAGIELANTAVGTFYIENSNFVLNGGYGINGSGAGNRTGALVNNAFVDNNGAVDDTGSVTGLKAISERYWDGSAWQAGHIAYATGTTPYSAPTTGNFRITAAAAQGTGRGAFTQLDGVNTGHAQYVDIGSGQHVGSAGGAHAWVQ